MVTRQQSLEILLVFLSISLRSYVTTKCIPDVYPNQYVLRAGSKLSLTCRINTSTPSCSEGFNKDNFQFEVNRTKFLPFDRRVSIVNSSTAILIIDNATVKDGGFYRCIYKKIPRVVNNFIKIGYIPTKVDAKSIKCMVHNWMSMNCTFDRGRDTWLPSTEYVIEYCMERTKTCHDCPVAGDGYCYWAKSYRHLCPSYKNKTRFFDNYTYGMRVRGTNSLAPKGVFSEYTEPVHAEWIVKPAAVKNAFIRVVNSTSINVTWEVDNNFKPQIFMLYLKSQYTPVIRKIQIDQSRPLQYMLVTGLLPYTTYQVNISAKPYVKVKDTMQEMGFWSDNVTAVKTTPTDVPSASPDLLPGSYRRHGCNAIHCKVTMMWPSLPQIYANGVIIGQKITLSPLGEPDHVTHTVDVERAGFSRSCVLQNLLRNTTYKVQLRASTDRGYTNNASSLIIPSDSTAPVAPQYVSAVKLNDAEVKLSWEYNGPPAEFMVFWCKGKDEKCLEKSDLEFRKVTTGHSVHIHPSDSVDQYIYAVSTTSQRSSLNMTIGSAMVVSACLYLLHNRTIPAPSISEDSRQPDYTISLRGLSVSCEDLEDVVLNYTVSYCVANQQRANCSDLELHVNRSTSQTDIKDLPADTTYLVWAQTISRSGKSALSNRLVITTTGLSSVELAVIVLGSLVGLVVTLAGFVFMVRKLKDKIKRCCRPFHFEIPANPELAIHSSEQTIARQYDKLSEETSPSKKKKNRTFSSDKEVVDKLLGNGHISADLKSRLLSQKLLEQCRQSEIVVDQVGFGSDYSLAYYLKAVPLCNGEISVDSVEERPLATSDVPREGLVDNDGSSGSSCGYKARVNRGSALTVDNDECESRPGEGSMDSVVSSDSSADYKFKVNRKKAQPLGEESGSRPWDGCVDSAGSSETSCSYKARVNRNSAHLLSGKVGSVEMEGDADSGDSCGSSADYKARVNRNNVHSFDDKCASRPRNGSVVGGDCSESSCSYVPVRLTKNSDHLLRDKSDPEDGHDSGLSATNSDDSSYHYKPRVNRNISPEVAPFVLRNQESEISSYGDACTSKPVSIKFDTTGLPSSVYKPELGNDRMNRNDSYKGSSLKTHLSKPEPHVADSSSCPSKTLEGSSNSWDNTRYSASDITASGQPPEHAACDDDYWGADSRSHDTKYSTDRDLNESASDVSYKRPCFS